MRANRRMVVTPLRALIALKMCYLASFSLGLFLYFTCLFDCFIGIKHLIGQRGISDEMKVKRAKTELNCINREGESRNYNFASMEQRCDAVWRWARRCSQI